MDKAGMEDFPSSGCAREMIGSVTGGFYDRSYVGKWLFQVMGLEYDDAKELAQELPMQMFPETATWGLKYHEIKWNLPVREELSLEERRRYIYQKRDEKYPMTPYRMEAHLARMTDLDIQVEDCNDPGVYGYDTGHPNRFCVVIVAEERPPEEEIEMVKTLLDRVKQSHTAYDIIIRRNLWYLDGAFLLDGTKLLNAEEQTG